MLDDVLRQLNTDALDRSLDSLESDMWATLALRVRHRVAARRRAAVQGAVMVLSLIVSIALGVHATRATVAHAPPLLASGLELAPSSLLLSTAR